MTNQSNIVPTDYGFSYGGPPGTTDITHIGLHLIEGDDETTVAIDVADALIVGKLLIANVDALTGREPRTWD